VAGCRVQRQNARYTDFVPPFLGLGSCLVSLASSVLPASIRVGEQVTKAVRIVENCHKPVSQQEIGRRRRSIIAIVSI